MSNVSARAAQITSNEITVEDYTMELRWSRNGILQQRLLKRVYAAGTGACVESEEWRDVPMEPYP